MRGCYESNSMPVNVLVAGLYTQPGGPLLARPAIPEVILGRIETWFHRAAADLLLARTITEDPQGRPVLFLRLHPAAEDLIFVGAGNGRLVVSARTDTAGPGYHVFVCDLLRRMGEDLEVQWAPRDEAEEVGDPTGYFHQPEGGGRRGEVEAAALAWLSSAARRLLEERRFDATRALPLSLRAGTEFELRTVAGASGAAVATPLGPRDAAWLQRVAEDPFEGVDVFPWWENGTGARVRLARALCRMWTDVRWRPPILDDERDAMRDVAAQLELAWRADPTLSFPWREWQEVLGYLGIGGTVAEEVRDRAAATGNGPSIGYRRGDVRIAVGGAWSIRVPGSFAERVEADGSFHGWDHRRDVRFQAIPVADDDPTPSLDRFAPRKPGSPAALEHAGPRVRSRAMLVEGTEGAASRLVTLCSSAGDVGVCTITWVDPDDREWALDTWRSVDHPPLAQ